MQSVRSKDTKPELAIRRLVFELGYRYRLHRKDLPGTPDLAFIARRQVIFVHGCFWHGHNCPRGARTPKANRDYWTQKILRNRLRDKAHQLKLKARGWRGLIIWECELKRPLRARARLVKFLKKSHATK
jgi:DNA mismatch endonuclease (patch repair protein)